MHFSSKTLATCLAVAGPALSQATESVSFQSVSGCAAVVSTTAICSSCMTADCVVPATITAGCGDCPATAATIFSSHGCDNGCEGLGGCQTVYTVVTSSGDCSAATSGPTPTPSDSVSALTTTAVSTGAARRLSPLRLW